jgi:hypothetical protein
MVKPKGKTTAYSYFVQRQKELFQEANPGGKIVFGDFMKECGAKWREIDPNDKVPFEKKSKKDATRYAREMDDYEPEDGPAQKKKKRKKDPNAPKRPQTAFFLFSGERREEVKKELPEGARVGDIAKRLGIMWGELDADEKKEYQEQAEDAKGDYEKAMEEYNATKVQDEDEY